MNSLSTTRVGNRLVGEGHPAFIIAEIGINHNGSLELAKKLVEGAARAGVDAVKFQKRTPEKCVPRDQWSKVRDTPWGHMRYIDYKMKMELSFDDFVHIDRMCCDLGIQWFASCWDEDAVEFVRQFDPPCIKASSASLTDLDLLRKMRGIGAPVMISTGMSTCDEIEAAVKLVGTNSLLIAHSTSSYPCPVDELNLKMIHTLKREYPMCPIGYSGHEVGLAPTWAAVALGATFIERHITLDRAMWGTDQSASVELNGLDRLVANIRDIEAALGDGTKRVYEGELEPRRRLRRHVSAASPILPC